MQQAAVCLLGEHDFTSYRAVECQARCPVREVRRLEISRSSDYVLIDIEANAFLHHMVRNIAGVLVAIGTGKMPVTWAQEVLDARDRTLGGVTMPAAGLYLREVHYPGHFRIPGAGEFAIQAITE